MAPRESSGWSLAPSRGDRRVSSAGGLLDGAAWAGNPCNRHSGSWPPSPEIEWLIPLAAPFLPSLQRISTFAKEQGPATRCLNPTNSVTAVVNERTIRHALIIIAFAALTVGLAAAFTGRNGLAQWIWAAGTVPVVASLAISIARDVLAGRMGVNAARWRWASHWPEWSSHHVCRRHRAGEFNGRAERDLSLLAIARPAYRKPGAFEDVPIDRVAVGVRRFSAPADVIVPRHL